MEELVDKIQDNTSHRREVTESTTTVTMDLIEKHLIQPTKVHTMIQAFMAMLSKDIQTLKDNTTMHATSLEELAYVGYQHCMINWKCGQHILGQESMKKTK
jgi:hypothetical protein